MPWKTALKTIWSGLLKIYSIVEFKWSSLPQSCTKPLYSITTEVHTYIAENNTSLNQLYVLLVKYKIELQVWALKIWSYNTKNQ